MTNEQKTVVLEGWRDRVARDQKPIWKVRELYPDAISAAIVAIFSPDLGDWQDEGSRVNQPEPALTVDSLERLRAAGIERVQLKVITGRSYSLASRRTDTVIGSRYPDYRIADLLDDTN